MNGFATCLLADHFPPINSIGQVWLFFKHSALNVFTCYGRLSRSLYIISDYNIPES